MKSFISILSVGLLLAGLTGCNSGPKSSKGFSLPDGNAQQGEATFVELKCHACHSVSGVTLPDIEQELAVRLGGEVSRIKTYGELVTSIINPSHRFSKAFQSEEAGSEGKSMMKNYNEEMTVKQLIDMVAFLQSQYKLREYEHTEYPTYPMLKISE